MSNEEIVSTSSQYSHPLHIRTDDQEYIQIKKLDYLRLLCKALLHSGLSASNNSQQRFEECYSNLNDSAKSDDYMYELMHSSSHDSEDIYQEIDSTFIRDQIYNYARTHEIDQSNDLSEDLPHHQANSKNVSRGFQLSTQETFRTLSHFGFLSPKHIRKPADYHMPSYRTYYKPLSRELSIEELFSSNKYVALPDECIRIIFKNKLASYKDFKQSTKRKLKFSTVAEDREIEDKENPFKKFFGEEEGDFVNTAQLKGAVSYRSCPNLPICLNRKVEYLVDNEKVGSAKNKDVFAPLAQSEYSDYGTQSENERLLNRDAQNQCYASEYETTTQQHVSCLHDQRLHTLKRSQSDRKISHYNITLNINKSKANVSEGELSNQLLDVSTQDIHNSILEDVTNKPRLSKSLPWEREKKLLSRSVRNERKKEFTEMWMNHLHLRKAQNKNEDNLSDERASPYADMEFDAMEEEIISKIDENHLDKDDNSIFTKIKTVIMERSINKKKLNSNDELDNLDASSSFSTSTPKLCRSQRREEVPQRNSEENSSSSQSIHTFLIEKTSTESLSTENDQTDLNSQFPLKNQFVSEKLIEVIPIITIPDVQQVKIPKLKSRKAKRNFIAENIRNASQGKRTPKINKSIKSVNRSHSAPRLYIDDLRLQRHNALFEARPFTSEIEITGFPIPGPSYSTDNETVSVDLEKACQGLIDFTISSTTKENQKIDELTENVNELKNVVERCEEQIDCLFLDKMEKEIDEIFNLHNEIYNDNAEHKEKFEKKILEDTERLKQLDLDLNTISD